MNRKIYILLTVLLAWSFNLKAQTAQIGSQTATPGAPVSFDIDVADLPANVGAVSLFIGYDPNVLTFTGSVGGTLSGYILNNMMETHQVGIQWTDPYGADINGTLLTLNFQYSELGGTCNVTFNPGCEFSDILLNSITVGYTNGSIGPEPGIATVSIDEIVANAGPVSFGVNGNGFTANAGAVTLYIDFDPSILQFSGYTSTLPSVMISGNNSTGRISVAYSSTIGASLNTTFLTLNFMYNATGSSQLVFADGCEITYTDLTPEVVSFDNGKIDPLATAYQLTIDDMTANPGNPVGVGISAAGYPENVGAVTLFIGYNPAHLTFLNLSPGTLSGADANVVSPGLLGISWTNSGGQDIDGIIFTMNFEYHFGASAITFEGGCDITDITLTEIPTTFNDGSIAPLVGGPEVSLPFQAGTIGQTIDFPVSAKNFSMDIAAISIFIGFNNSVLTYSGNSPGTITGYFINYMPATSQIGLQWSTYPGININPNNPDPDILFTLHFIYNGGTCDMTFNAGCEFAEPDLTTVPVSFFDGGIITGSRFSFKVFLEGPFDGSSMMYTGLNDLGELPLAQPYSGDTWYYAGTEAVNAIPNASVVDWVLLEFRETVGDVNTADASTIVAQQAAFVLNDGSVVGLDGSSEVVVPTAFTANVYVVIYHRNHIRVMSASALTMVGDIYVYDFTDAAAKAFNSQQKDLGGGFYGMYAADGLNDGEVFSGDLGVLLNEYPTFGGYNAADFNLDGEVFSADLGLLLNNYPTFTSIP
jgi:hypothetical protein